MDIFAKVMVLMFIVGCAFPFIVKERGKGAILMFAVCLIGIVSWQITEYVTLAFAPLAFSIGISFGFPVYNSYRKYKIARNVSRQLQLFD